MSYPPEVLVSLRLLAVSLEAGTRRDALLALVDDAEDKQAARAMRDQLLRRAAALIPGKPYTKAKRLEEIQLWLLARRERPVREGTAEYLVAKALGYGEAIGFEQLKRVLRD